MSVLCRDIKTLFQHNLSFSTAFECYRDINFFVATKLFVFQPCSILQHNFEKSQHKIHCRDSLLLSHFIFCRNRVFFCRDRILYLQLFNFVVTFFAMLRHTFVVLLNLYHDNNFFCHARVSYCYMGLLSQQTFSLS